MRFVIDGYNMLSIAGPWVNDVGRTQMRRFV